ncbi:AAA family ATPase [Paenibacillus sp.]|uniref:AAA family ATPase n=1 Tax=Paenibacillus sp. TaxID=58172 RepID=UPI002D65D72A|nr:AAA family ATPase [Paenibacillus sp.]HZG86232.1 AAA family ATPase [Paenibacillus sp.]
MRLEMKNIGLLGKADIEINGLTVIAGENDTGKSTIGKVLFSIIKAFTRYSEDFAEETRKSYFNMLETVYFQLRKYVDFNEHEALRKEFLPPRIFRDIEYSLDVGNFENIDLILSQKIELIKNLNLPTRIMESTVHTLLNLRSSIIYTNEKKEYIVKALKLAFMSEFNSEISNKYIENESLIKCTEGNNKVLEISIIKDQIDRIEYFDELFFSDATYIESPLVLQMYDAISKSTAFFEEEELFTKSSIVHNRASKKVQIAFHLKDLINKMENAQYFKSFNKQSEEEDIQLFNRISNLIGGDVSFKKQQRDFVYSKKSIEKDINIKSGNLATGIKSFGILQLLLKAGLLNERTLIILDEPEIHLHPKWQVEYCKMIIELVKRDINILVTTHSPYILQALKVFAENSDMDENRINYYFAEKESGNNHVNIENINGNLNKAFRKLSEPIQKLVWEN